MKQLILVRHAPTTATRQAAFPADEPLDDLARGAAAALQAALPAGATALSSPARRALETAMAAGLRPKVEARLAECDFGTWAGSSLAELHRADPDATSTWMTDPDAAPHCGESLTAFSSRVAAWLQDEVALARDVVAVTHAGVIRAAVAHVLGASVSALWRILVEPLSITELRADGDIWSVARVNAGPR